MVAESLGGPARTLDRPLTIDTQQRLRVHADLICRCLHVDAQVLQPGAARVAHDVRHDLLRKAGIGDDLVPQVADIAAIASPARLVDYPLLCFSIAATSIKDECTALDFKLYHYPFRPAIAYALEVVSK
jgi:hypothetical protein